MDRERELKKELMGAMRESVGALRELVANSERVLLAEMKAMEAN